MTALFLALEHKEDCTENLESSAVCESLYVDPNIFVHF